MKKKIIGILVCMLLVGTVLPVSGTLIIDTTTSSYISGNTLYVGGSGEGNYTKIQDAINDSVDGDTVFVYDESSPYYENLVIDVSINLLGHDKYTTIIDGNENEEGDVICIKADGIMVQGFTIQNSSLKYGNESEKDYGIEIISDNNIIKDNVIVDNYYGIQIGSISPKIYSYDNVIEGNIITENMWAGLSLYCAFNNIISGNFISSNGGDGISLYFESSNNLITYNNISFNTDTGVHLHGEGNNKVLSNNIIGNGFPGVIIYWSGLNEVRENNIFNNNKKDALIVATSWDIKTIDNTFDGNYWGSSQLLFKLIRVILCLILPTIIALFLFNEFVYIFLIKIDWNPAKEPYDI